MATPYFALSSTGTVYVLAGFASIKKLGLAIILLQDGGRASREEGERSHGACSEAGGARGVCSCGVGWGWLSDLRRSAIDRHRGGSSQRRHARRE